MEEPGLPLTSAPVGFVYGLNYFSVTFRATGPRGQDRKEGPAVAPLESNKRQEAGRRGLVVAVEPEARPQELQSGLTGQGIWDTSGHRVGMA